VRALDERKGSEITFPRLVGYRVEIPQVPLAAEFSEESRMAISTQDVPSWTESAGIVGEHAFHSLEELAAARRQQVEFTVAKRVYERRFPDEPARFAEVLRIVRRWMGEALTLKDKVFPGYLLFSELAAQAAEKIGRAIDRGTLAKPGAGILKPILAPYDAVGSTAYVDFQTTRPLWPTSAEKCHVSHVVADTKTWEQKLAQAIEEMPEVVRYVKNAGLGFVIPYTVDGNERRYLPDFLLQVDDGRGADDLLQLIVEGTGEKDIDKEAKVDTARNLWVPAVNADGSFGRWVFLELRDPWNAQTEIRAFLAGLRTERAA
jgi:type III restriction enzyme